MEEHTTETTSVVLSSKTILDKPSKWDLWIYQIMTNANEYGIWDYVNPDLPEKPLPPAEPTYQTAPEIAHAFRETRTDALIEENIAVTDTSLSQTQITKSLTAYRTASLAHERKCKCFIPLLKLIQNTISLSYLRLLNKASHPYDALVLLKKHVKPIDEARQLEAQIAWGRLQRAPKNQPMTKWLEEWKEAYNKGVDAKIADVEGLRPAQAFI